MTAAPTRSPADVRAALLERREIALLDVREEDPYAQEHPLWAANLPLSRLELDVLARIPRRATPVVVYDDGEGLAEVAARRLGAIGYTEVALLDGGLAGWRAAGGERFRDVNVPSKAFGEWVEAECHTPSLPAAEVRALLDAKADVVVLDARRYDEFRTMSIPGAINVPGGELVLRARVFAPTPATRVIVNCAGRTRSIIGAQSLVNAGIPNPVAALRNGTIGWTLAGYPLDRGAERRHGKAIGADRGATEDAARALAERAGAGRATFADLERWQEDAGRTTYLFDVRTLDEYEAGHLSDARGVPGGQLVQETDVVAPVRGARIVLADDDGVRAAMAASWLAQMGWEAHVLERLRPADFGANGPWIGPVAELGHATCWVTPQQLAAWLRDAPDRTRVIDLATSASHVARHIPGAWWALRSQLGAALRTLPAAPRIVLTCGNGLLARFAARDLAEDAAAAGRDVSVLRGGNAAWVAAGLPVESGDARLASPRIDRYRRPYEGTDNAREAMQAYLDWEFGLVEQLKRDGTHHFRVVRR